MHNWVIHSGKLSVISICFCREAEECLNFLFQGFVWRGKSSLTSMCFCCAPMCCSSGWLECAVSKDFDLAPEGLHTITRDLISLQLNFEGVMCQGWLMYYSRKMTLFCLIEWILFFQYAQKVKQIWNANYEFHFHQEANSKPSKIWYQRNDATVTQELQQCRNQAGLQNFTRHIEIFIHCKATSGERRGGDERRPLSKPSRSIRSCRTSSIELCGRVKTAYASSSEKKEKPNQLNKVYFFGWNQN
jgi:hypothetical protein